MGDKGISALWKLAESFVLVLTVSEIPHQIQVSNILDR